MNGALLDTNQISSECCFGSFVISQGFVIMLSANSVLFCMSQRLPEKLHLDQSICEVLERNVVHTILIFLV